MKDDTTQDFANAQAFDTGKTLFLSDVIARVKAELDGSQRRDTLSAFNALERCAEPSNTRTHNGLCAPRDRARRTGNGVLIADRT
jgi:hypothetical protein